jgi:phosphate transport system protein
MLQRAIDAFVRHDATVAAELVATDVQIDEQRDALRTGLLQLMSHQPQAVAASVDLIFIVQSIERVGDHAKNIAEYVVTVVEGVDPRHPTAA